MPPPEVKRQRVRRQLEAGRELRLRLRDVDELLATTEQEVEGLRAASTREVEKEGGLQQSGRSTNFRARTSPVAVLIDLGPSSRCRGRPICRSRRDERVLESAPPALKSKRKAMSLSPDEIEHKNFVVALRGYDKNEVDEFLKAVADEYREVVRAKERALESAGEGPLDPFKQLGEQVAVIARAAADGASQILAEAERSRSALLESAGREAATIREQARQELEAAQAQRDHAIREVSELRESAEKEAAGIKAAAEEQVAHARRLGEQARQELEALRAQRDEAIRAASELRESAEQEAARVKAAAEEQVAHARRLCEQARQELDAARAQRDESIREASQLRESAEQEAARAKAAAEEQVVEAARLREQAKTDSDVVVYLLEAAWAEVAAAEELRVAAEKEAHQTVAGATEEARQRLEAVQHDVEALGITPGSNLAEDRTP